MTREEALAIMRSGLVTGSGGKISRETVETYGTTAHAVALMGAYAAVELAWKSAERYRALFVPTAFGVDLEELGHDGHDTPIRGASSAVVELVLDRTDTSDELTVDAGTVITGGGVRFALDDDVLFTAGEAGPKTVKATSLLAGLDQNVEAGTLTSIVDSPQADLTVTQSAKAAGGNDRESDEEYRARIAMRYTAAARGVFRAIEAGLLTVPQIRSVAVYEVLDVDGNPYGTGEAWIADAQGNANAALVALAQQAIARDWRALGIPIDVFGATVVTQAISVSIEWATGKATPANAHLVKQAIKAIVNTRRPRSASSSDEVSAAAKLTHDLIAGAARTVRGVEGVTVTLPVGTVIPERGEVIRAGTIQVL